MMQNMAFYDFSTFSITTALFFVIILVNEAAFQMGCFVQNRTNEEIKALTGAIQASILGLLALLLGFTFSMSMKRYDDRSQALLAETNAIGTVMLRIQLLPEEYQGEAASLLRQYVDLRIATGKVDVTRVDDRKRYRDEISGVQSALWSLAVRAVRDENRALTTGAFISALNQMIDSEGHRNALIQMHVPEVVILLLFLVFMSAGGIMGYSSGLTGRRVIVPTVMVSFLISLIVFIILDLDRPKRGFIQVDQSPMLMLVDQFN